MREPAGEICRTRVIGYQAEVKPADDHPVNFFTQRFHQPQPFRKGDAQLVGDIDRTYMSVPESEPAVGDDQVRLQAGGETPEVVILPDRRDYDAGQLQEYAEVLWQVAGVSYMHSPYLRDADARELAADQRYEAFIDPEDHLIASPLQLRGQRDHPAGMSETPVQGADEYPSAAHGAYPETDAGIPSASTLSAMACSSPAGTFMSSLPSGVSRSMVYIITD